MDEDIVSAMRARILDGDADVISDTDIAEAMLAVRRIRNKRISFWRRLINYMQEFRNPCPPPHELRKLMPRRKS
jgi:hypothetical protein